MAEKLSFKGALLKLRKAPNDATAQARVTDEIQDRALLALDAEGNIDTGETDEGVTFANRPGRRLNSMEGRVSLSDWLSRQVPRDEACPISGRLLYKGVTTQGRPKVDWSQVPMSRRFAVAMARLNHEPAAQIGQEELAASAMKQEVPPVPFSRFLQEWAELAKAVEGGRPSAAQRNLHQASKDACYHEEAPAAAGSSFLVETVSTTATTAGSSSPYPCGGGATGNCRTPNCAWPACAAPGAAPAVQTPQAGAPLLYIKAHSSDLPWVARLRSHLTLMERRGGVEIFDETQIPPGVNRSDVIARNLRRAAVVLYLVSSDMLATIDVAAVRAAAAQARHIPFLVRPSFGVGEAFGGTSGLPRSGKPASKWDDADSCAAEVVGELRGVIESAERTRR